TDDLELVAGRAATLQRYAADGWTLLGIAWRPEVADGTATGDAIAAVFASMQAQLGVAIDVRSRPHRLGAHVGCPADCASSPQGPGRRVFGSRKPLPGIGVEFIRRYRLDPSRCLY